MTSPFPSNPIQVTYAAFPSPYQPPQNTNHESWLREQTQWFPLAALQWHHPYLISAFIPRLVKGGYLAISWILESWNSSLPSTGQTIKLECQASPNLSNKWRIKPMLGPCMLPIRKSRCTPEFHRGHRGQQSRHPIPGRDSGGRTPHGSTKSWLNHLFKQTSNRHQVWIVIVLLTGLVGSTSSIWVTSSVKINATAVPPRARPEHNGPAKSSWGRALGFKTGTRWSISCKVITIPITWTDRQIRVRCEDSKQQNNPWDIFSM